MGRLPKTMKRPKVIKASATDIPVLYKHDFKRESKDKGRPKQGFIPRISRKGIPYMVHT